jgi:hypothetical protein
MMSIMMSLAISMTVIFVAAAVYVYMVKKHAAANPRGCPVCDTPLPAFRRPASFQQALWGGWTCDGCSTELDRHGNKLAVR